MHGSPAFAAVTSWHVAAASAALVMLLGLTLLLVGRRERTTARLALLLGAYGASQLTYALWRVVPDRSVSYHLYVFSPALSLSAALLYLAFLGVALDAPLARPLRGRVAQAGLLGAAALVLLAPIVDASFFWRGPATRSATGTWQFVQGPGDAAANWTTALVALLALATAVQAWSRSAQGSQTRLRYGAYLLAFAILDVGNLLSAGVEILVVNLLQLPATHAFEVFNRVAWWLLVPAAMVAFAALLVRALLRHQLFDFELKVKWTLQRGTLGAIFLATFFLVSEGAQALFTGWSGSVILGILATAALVFALAPLQRVAERVADRAMPRVQATDAYIEFKKLEVYRAALESAYEGVRQLPPRERSAVERLRVKLAIDPDVANAVEADVVRALA